ncbi:MAG TPA: MarR family transcriptional regulator [Acetobacteraceae bacterium]|jgi:DNA-binding MarR family transcriptional regulator|nr:MarR family transcriptional regulator [Acetobacteraceae bacterium]
MKKAARSKKPRSVSALESHLGYWLRFVSNRVSHAFSLKVQARGVTAAEWVVLRELYEREDMPSALAERLGMTRGAISKLAERLAAKGLITREASDEDRRSQTLALTAAGGALVPALAALADENEEAFFGQLDRSTRQTIETAMREIVRREGLRGMPVD